MFAAGKKSVTQAVDVGVDDWLRVGKSFTGGNKDDIAKTKPVVSESALQVYTQCHDKHYKKIKRHKEKKRVSAKLVTVTSRESRHPVKHTKRKDKKRRRSSFHSDMSDGDATKFHSSERSRYRRYRSRSFSLSRSQKEERQIVNPSVSDDLALAEKAERSVDKLYELDRRGDSENQFFGTSYIHDQPLYDLATRRNLSTGEWVSKARSNYIKTDTWSKKNIDQDSSRYFSSQARKIERNGRQKRLYLAYSDKRLSRATAEIKEKQLDQDTGFIVNSLPEMNYIPLDPLLKTDDIEMKAIVFDKSDSEIEGLLTDGQSVELHLVERSKMLNAAVASNPHDINNWLDLMAFQEQTIRLQTKTKKVTTAVKDSVVEKQAAILAKALTNNPESRVLQRVKLNMSLQNQTSSDVADVDPFQQQLIESFIAKDVTNCDLWLKLLQSRQQHFSSFSLPSVRDLYARIIAVLRVECASAWATTTGALSLSNKSKNVKNAGQADEIAAALIEFHFLMCRFEKSAGYRERSLAHLQALIDFNLNEVASSTKSENKDTHLMMLQKFANRWNDKRALRFGDKRDKLTGPGTEELLKGFLNPSLAQFQDHIDKTCVVNSDLVNPPTVLRTDEHKRSLQSASAVYRRQSRHNSGADAKGSIHKELEHDRNSTASDESEVESGGGRLIYSNLHGCRIKINDANDSREYERILDNLRGTTEHKRARQIQLLKKEKNKREHFAATVAQVDDQRARYAPINKSDHFIRWISRENIQTQLQWAPLRSNNPLHQDLIEQQPDRVTLTEEIQPFLFSVPIAYHWRLIAEILHICGIEWQGEFSWETSLLEGKSLYADDAAKFELLVGPILSVLNPQNEEYKSKKDLLFLKPIDRKNLLEKALLRDVAAPQEVLCDPSKVVFVRRIFAQALSLFHTMNEYDKTALKCLWIGFELEIIRAIGATEEIIANARLLIKNLAIKSTDGDPHLHLDVLYSYAKLELAIGNELQVRRICENALKSLGGYAMVSRRYFHRFVFLHARLELWSSSKYRDKPQLRVLRCLNVLWDAWQSNQSNGDVKESLNTIAKKYKNRTSAYLQKKLISDLSFRTELIARYRADLDLALQHCADSASHSPEHAKACIRKTIRSKCWAHYCLHNLALVVYAYDGLNAAYHEYRHFLVNSEHQICAHNGWAWTCFLEFMQQHQVAGLSPILAPRLWRLSISEAVENFPHNQLFLRLFADSEYGNPVSQVLRNYFFRIEERWRRHYDSFELVECLFALLCEFYRVERAAVIKELSTHLNSNTDSLSRPRCCVFHRWGMNAAAITRIRHMFENIVNQIRTKGSALCWELYMCFEVALGKVDAATKVLYRGIAACAWSKSLYMAGLRLLRAYLTEDECQELIEFMEAKELSVRAELE